MLKDNMDNIIISLFSCLKLLENMQIFHQDLPQNYLEKQLHHCEDRFVKQIKYQNS